MSASAAASATSNTSWAWRSASTSGRRSRADDALRRRRRLAAPRRRDLQHRTETTARSAGSAGGELSRRPISPARPADVLVRVHRAHDDHRRAPSTSLRRAGTQRHPPRSVGLRQGWAIERAARHARGGGRRRTSASTPAATSPLRGARSARPRWRVGIRHPTWPISRRPCSTVTGPARRRHFGDLRTRRPHHRSADAAQPTTSIAERHGGRPRSRHRRRLRHRRSSSWASTGLDWIEGCRRLQRLRHHARRHDELEQRIPACGADGSLTTSLVVGGDFRHVIVIFGAGHGTLYCDALVRLRPSLVSWRSPATRRSTAPRCRGRWSSPCSCSAGSSSRA